MTDFRSQRSQGLRLGMVSVLVVGVLIVGLFVGVLLGRRGVVPSEGAGTSAASQPVASVPTVSSSPTVAPPAPADVVTLSGREAVLAGQLAALETRASALTATADAASGQAARAEALLTALAARRALDRGQPLGGLDGQLQARFGSVNARAVAVVREAARQPVTLEDLRQALDAIGPAAVAGVSDGWLAAARREIGGLVVLRRAGAPSPRPVEHLIRARRLLDQGQVEAALTEVALLPGADDAANWRTAAVRYIQARRALDALEVAALSAPLPAPVVPPAPGPMPQR